MTSINHDRYEDGYVRDILHGVKTIAIVGASPKEIRPSYFVLRYLVEKGYTVFPVNPGHAGRTIAGREVYGSLSDIPHPVDMVDVFRSSEAAAGVVDEALALSPLPAVVWMQLGVRNDEAAAKAEAQGVRVVMNRCPKIEYGRLSGEIAWSGVNRRTISSRKPALSGRGFQRLSIAPGANAGGRAAPDPEQEGGDT